MTMKHSKPFHSKEVTRVIQDDNRLLGYDEYLKKYPTVKKRKVGQLEKKY
jgi:hypothetical protein